MCALQCRFAKAATLALHLLHFQMINGCVGIQRIYIWYRKRQLNDGIRSRSETTFPKDAYIRTSLALFVFSYTQVNMALTSLSFRAFRMI
jgi:hypothetical protein